MLSIIASIGSFLAGFFGLSGWLERRAAREQGMADQAAKDTAETLRIVTAERDAAEQAGDAQQAAREGKF